MNGTPLTVDIIPADRPAVRPGGQLNRRNGLRVAAYCRVSTDQESQQTSYAAQQAYYSRFIRARPGWIFAGIYADEGISGTSAARREAFNRMIRDAKAGRLDYIVTKSISRFARNTLLTLDCVRELRQLDPPVGIFFEKENLDTLDAAGELLLTILSALAQDESRSISENIRWSIRKKFEAGEPIVNLNRMIGYDPGPDGVWLINEEQAATVRRIFSAFADGAGAGQIARELNEAGRLTVNGCRWTACSVLIVLRNEKYVGDVEMQKYVTKDFLTHRSSPNNGEAPRYYIRDHHAPIVSRALWDAVQARLPKPDEARDTEAEPPAPVGAPFHILRCAACGRPFRRVTQGHVIPGYADERCAAASGADSAQFREQYKFYNSVRVCSGRSRPQDAAYRCSTPILSETGLEQSFTELLYSLKRDVEAKDEESVLCTLFRKACADRTRSGESRITQLRLETVNEQLAALEQTDNGLQSRARREELLQERDLLEKNTNAMYRRIFDAFLRELAALPEGNAAGAPLRVNGLDADGTCFRAADGTTRAKRSKDFAVTQAVLDAAPDLLPFDRALFERYVTGGTVHGDVIRYDMTFGVSLACVGNSRTLSDFLGFRRGCADGTTEFLDTLQKICGAEIRYTRKAR